MDRKVVQTIYFKQLNQNVKKGCGIKRKNYTYQDQIRWVLYILERDITADDLR